MAFLIDPQHGEANGLWTLAWCEANFWRLTMSHKRLVTALRRSWIGYTAIGLAVAVSVAPASFAQDSRVLDHCKAAGTGIEAEERQTPQRPGSNTGVFVAVPIGRVCVGPEFVNGEPSYVRRLKVREGMTIVEVSTTPFMEEPSGIEELIRRPDELPASW